MKAKFDYLDYKNIIPLEKCEIHIPTINPLSMNYSRFWNGVMKRKQIEGHWVEHEGSWQWIPGILVQYCNLFKIERKPKGGTAKNKVIDKPDLRDIEWIKGFVFSVARGFSGFADDEEYSCHRVLISPEKDLIIPYLDDKVKSTLYKPNGELKEYKEALPYLYEYKTRNLGKPYFHNEAKNVMEIGARNYGKMQEANTPVLTPNGEIPIKDINIGDLVYGEDGNTTKVIGKYDHYDKELYKVVLQDGRSILVGADHLWGVFHRTKYKVVDTKYMLSTKYKSKRSNGYMEYAFRIPLTKPVNFVEKDLLIDPYFLGLWLGDGISRTVGITNEDPEIVDYIYKIAEETNSKVRHRRNNYFLSSYKQKDKNSLIRKFKSLDLIQNKHIPEEYFLGSIEQRMSLLQGLMDSDGTIGFKGYSTFDNVNYKLIKGVERLCWSLGIKTNLKTKNTTWVYKGERKRSLSYRLFLNTELPIFRLTRKLEKVEKRTSAKAISSASSSAIVDIIPTGEIKHSVCISVDNESKLYLANDYIVTHNTMSTANMCAYNFLTDGVTDYDEWYENSLKPKDERVTYTTLTLIGAIDAKYVNNLTKHLKIGLDNLPGATKSGGLSYPPPLSKKTVGSWVVGKDRYARYEEKVGGEWETKGSGSGFAMRSFNDNPYAANGLRYGLGVIDEVGFMGNLIDTLGQLHECTTSDGEKYGTIWCTGTGGDMTSGATEAAMKIFYNGEADDFLVFDDVFEDKGTIGLFIPAWMVLSEFRDELGNINKELAITKLMKEREIAAKSDNKETLYNLLQMKPLVPSEAFLVLEGNIFPVGELKEHLANLESSEKTSDLGNTGMMRRDVEGKAFFKVDHSLKPADYPTNAPGSSEGCVVVWEEPEENPPYGLYIAGIDSYDIDKVENSVSYGSIIIYKRFSSFGTTSHLPVAEYTGRPDFANDFYEQCRRLLEWYNAKALYENLNVGIKKYFETKFCLHLLHRQPDIIKQISPNSNVSRGYGIHMTKPIKTELEIMTRDWLNTEIGEGKTRLQQILSIPLLKELIAYNDTGNFDRCIAFFLCIIQDVEMHRVQLQEKSRKSIDSFFDKRLYV